MSLPGYTYSARFTVNGVSSVANNTIIPLFLKQASGTNTKTTYYLGSSRAQANFADIRFTKSDGTTLLKYFLWNYSGTTALVFVQLDSVPAFPGTADFYIWYGNSSAVDASDSSIFSYLYESMQSAPSGSLLGNATYDSTNKWTLLNPATSSTQGSLLYTLASAPQNYGMVWLQKIGGGSGADSMFAFTESDDTYPVGGDVSSTGYNIISDEYTEYFRLSGNATQIANESLTVDDNAWHTLLFLLRASGSDRVYRVDYDYVTQFSGITTITPTGPNRQEFGWNSRSGGSTDNHYLGACAVFPYVGLQADTWSDVPPLPPVVDIAISQTTDMMWYEQYSTDSFVYTDFQIGLNYGYTPHILNGGWLRWLKVNVPPGVTITKAYFTWKARTAQSSTMYSYITGNKQADAPAITDVTTFQNQRGTIVGGATNDYITTAQVNYQPPAQVDGTWYQSPDISPIIQEIIDQPAWASGGAMALFWDDFDQRTAATCSRIAYTYYASAANAPVLHIEFSSTNPLITTTELPDAPFGSNYDQTLEVYGGTAPYTFEIISGSLPTGLKLNPNTGRISGYCKYPAVGNTITFKVTDSVGGSSTSNLILKSHFPTLGPNLATSTANAPVSGRVSYYGQGRYWLLHRASNGDIAATSSIDGVNWTSPVTIYALGTSYTYDFDSAFDGTYFHILWWQIGNYWLQYIRAKPNADGSVTVDSVQSVPTTGSGADLIGGAGIEVDANGYPWVAYGLGAVGVSQNFVQTSTTKDGTWNNVTSWQANPYPGSYSLKIIPLSDGGMVLAVNPDSGAAFEWYYDGSWHLSSYQVTPLTEITSPSIAVNSNNEVALACLDKSTYALYVSIRDPVTRVWTMTTVYTGTVSGAAPVIAETYFGWIVFFIDKANSRVYYICNKGAWETTPTFWIDQSAAGWTTPDFNAWRLSSIGPFTGSSKAQSQWLVNYMVASSSPYTVYQAVLYDAVFPQQGFGSPLPKLKAALFLENGLGK